MGRNLILNLYQRYVQLNYRKRFFETYLHLTEKEEERLMKEIEKLPYFQVGFE